MSTQPPPIGMSAPPPPPPPPATSSARKGCFIAVGVVLLVIVVVCLAGFIMAARNPARLAAWGSGMAMKQAEAALAPDVSADLRREMHDETEAYLAWLRSQTGESAKQLGPPQIQAPLTYLQEAMKDRAITADEARTFIDHLRRARGAETAAPETAAPVPEATAPPTP